jgi:hypothetical protein
MENLDDLIEINLNLIYNANRNEIFSHEFVDIHGEKLTQKSRGIKFQKELENEGLIRTDDTLCTITKKGFEIAKSGGWKNHLTELSEAIIKQEQQKNEKDNLEHELAISNIEANKLNKKIAKRNEKNEKNNRIATWINIGIGIINISLLLWQVLKSK